MTMSKSVRNHLDCWLMWKGPEYCEHSHLWKEGLGYIRKLTEHGAEKGGQQAVFLHGLCSRFLPWIPVLAALSDRLLSRSTTEKFHHPLSCLWPSCLSQQWKANLTTGIMIVSWFCFLYAYPGVYAFLFMGRPWQDP